MSTHIYAHDTTQAEQSGFRLASFLRGLTTGVVVNAIPYATFKLNHFFGAKESSKKYRAGWSCICNVGVTACSVTKLRQAEEERQRANGKPFVPFWFECDDQRLVSPEEEYVIDPSKISADRYYWLGMTVSTVVCLCINGYTFFKN
jgi:hypothetical protein